jgi:hypothetical protein
MEEIMETLIPLIKSDRLREIILYKSKDYSFRLGENKYIYLSKINIKINKNNYCFQIRDNQSEQKFFISINDSCIYLTVMEIYDLLKRICDDIGTKRIKNILMGKRNKIAKIDYLGLPFEVLFFTSSIPKGKLFLPESNIKINYEYLFLLIALIQDKSNYLWKLSNVDNGIYINGILRLLTCFISTKQNEILKKYGWDYNLSNERYYFNIKKLSKPITTKDKKGNDIKIKYYLTQEQYEDIMNLRNPSNFVNDGGTLK